MMSIFLNNYEFNKKIFLSKFVDQDSNSWAGNEYTIECTVNFQSNNE